MTFAVSAIPREAFSSPNVLLEDYESVRWGGSSQPQGVQVFIPVVLGNALFWCLADWKTGFLLPVSGVDVRSQEVMEQKRQVGQGCWEALLAPGYPQWGWGEEKAAGLTL